MSSLAATQADGYYVPPEYYESGQYKKKTRNQFHDDNNNMKKNGIHHRGSSSSSASSKGHNQFLQYGIVRFELPYKGVCQNVSCTTKSIGRGTRYNATKKIIQTDQDDDGKDNPISIVEYSMKCHDCQHSFIIRTNRHQNGYDYISGITVQKGQVQVNPRNSNRTFRTEFFALNGQERPQGGKEDIETMVLNQRRLMTENEQLRQIEELNRKTKLNDAKSNAAIRKRFRIDRKDKRLRLANATKLGWRKGMEVMSPSTPLPIQDQIIAKATVYGQAKQAEKHRFGTVRQSSIFSDNNRKLRKRQRDKGQSQSDGAIDTRRPRPVRSASIVPNRIISSNSNSNSVHDNSTDQSGIGSGEPIPDVAPSSSPVQLSHPVQEHTIATEEETTTTTTTEKEETLTTPKRRKISIQKVLGQTKKIKETATKQAVIGPCPVSTCATSSSSLVDVLAGYGSESEDDNDDGDDNDDDNDGQ